MESRVMARSTSTQLQRAGVAERVGEIAGVGGGRDALLPSARRRRPPTPTSSVSESAASHDAHPSAIAWVCALASGIAGGCR